MHATIMPAFRRGRKVLVSTVAAFGLSLALIALVALAPVPALAASCITPELYASTNTGTTTPSFIRFTSISNTGAGGCTYQNLRITGLTGGTSTCATDDPYVLLQLGDSGTLDTGNNYAYVLTYNYGIGVSEHNAHATNAIEVGQVPCSSRPASSPGTFNCLIINAFTSSFYKNVMCQGSISYADATHLPNWTDTETTSGFWTGSAAISDVNVVMSPGSFDQHSVVTLYLE